MRSFKQVVAVGLGVALSACGGDAKESSPKLVPADQVKEIQEAGASLRAVDGPTPLVVRDSLKVGVSAAERQTPENETLSGVSGFAGPVELTQEGSIAVSGGFWGISNDLVVGNWCRTGHIRDFAEASVVSGTGWCTVRNWYSESQSDCRILVHIGAAPFEAGTCRWRVYSHALTTPPPPPPPGCPYGQADVCGDGTCQPIGTHCN